MKPTSVCYNHTAPEHVYKLLCLMPSLTSPKSGMRKAEGKIINPIKEKIMGNVNMEAVHAALKEKGIVLSGPGIGEKEVLRVARGQGIDPRDFSEPETVRVGHYTNKRGSKNLFVLCPTYVTGRKENGLAQTVRGPMVRLEVAKKVIADLTEGVRLAEAGEVEDSLND